MVSGRFQEPLPVRIHAVHVYMAYVPYREGCLETLATGIKSGFPYCANSSIPSTCVFDDTARQTIDWMGQELGTNHIGYWVDEPSSQAEWDAWGYFLQGASPPPPPPSPRPPPGPPSPVSERFPFIPRQHCLFTPELQWESRGERRILQGANGKRSG
jgi:hypothetical protein